MCGGSRLKILFLLSAYFTINTFILATAHFAILSFRSMERKQYNLIMKNEFKKYSFKNTKRTKKEW